MYFNLFVLLAVSLINGKLVQSFTPSTCNAFLKDNKVSVANVPETKQSSYSRLEPTLTFVDIPEKRRLVTQCFSAKESETSKADNDDVLEFVKAEDGEALQALFEKQCDKDGLMTKTKLVSIPLISDLLSTGDLLREELDDIWNAAPKFPDLDSKSPERIDVDSFIEIYRDIDDIFEDDDEDKDINNDFQADKDNSEEKVTTKATTDQEVDGDDEELKEAFKSICNEGGLVTKEELKSWEEIVDLFDDNMLDEGEFNSIWDEITNTGSKNEIDLKAFLAFNAELDELFVFDEDDDPKSDDEKGEEAPIQMFYGDDLPAGVVFAELADDDFLIGMKELRKWGDLQDMLAEGELLPIELQNMFELIPKAPGTNNKINEEGFESLFEAIEDLFEEEGEEEDLGDSVAVNLKSDLLDMINLYENDEEKMSCGLDSTENEVQNILNIIAQLETQTSNIVLSSGGDVTPTDVAGDWELLYTTSSTMKFNKGLSGLVPPNGKFGGLRQKLKASKYLADIEYIEQIDAGPASFEVRVTGDWELRNSVSLFTGSRSVALSVEPDKVYYGLTSQRADHWKSLGPLNLLDIAYLDDDLRIMRGTTSTDSVFVFKRTSS
mmetsp:Transcript_13326/g.20207  ORF Transcript_13326/g.20207 Transcript_13326/m.20207 type:complete len:607 (-) Transcript_13326:57-1877(-)